MAIHDEPISDGTQTWVFCFLYACVLVVGSQLLRASWLTHILFGLLPFALTYWWFQIWEGWFIFVKAYSVTIPFSMVTLPLRYIFPDSRLLPFLVYLALVANILEAVVKDAQLGHWINMVSGILLVLTQPGPQRVYVNQDVPLKDMLYDIPLPWITSYTAWNFCFVFGSRNLGWQRHVPVLLVAYLLPFVMRSEREERLPLTYTWRGLSFVYDQGMWLWIRACTLAQHICFYVSVPMVFNAFGIPADPEETVYLTDEPEYVAVACATAALAAVNLVAVLAVFVDTRRADASYDVVAGGVLTAALSLAYVSCTGGGGGGGDAEEGKGRGFDGGLPAPDPISQTMVDHIKILPIDAPETSVAATSSTRPLTSSAATAEDVPGPAFQRPPSLPSTRSEEVDIDELDA